MIFPGVTKEVRTGSDRSSRLSGNNRSLLIQIVVAAGSTADRLFLSRLGSYRQAALLLENLIKMRNWASLEVCAGPGPSFIL